MERCNWVLKPVLKALTDVEIVWAGWWNLESNKYIDTYFA